MYSGALSHLRIALLTAALIVVAVLGVGCGASPDKPLALGASTALPRSPRSHVVVIVMENAEYGEVIASSQAPYVNALARRYGLATQSFAVTHPSLPNYLRMQRPVDHYDVLATIEQVLGLPPLAAAADPRAGRLTPLFRRMPRVR